MSAAVPPESIQKILDALLRGRVDEAQLLLASLPAIPLEDSASSTCEEPERRHRLAERARAMLGERTLRSRHVDPEMFGEPGWDMLLLLYSEQSGARMTSSRLADRSGASRSTALRWLDFLVTRNLVIREPHPTDRRMYFVQLSAAGRQKLEAFLAEVRT